MIDISICPTALEFANGDKYDPKKLVVAVGNYAQAEYPDNHVCVQIGSRQGQEWAVVDGDRDAGEDLLRAFWEKHGNDEDLFLSEDDEEIPDTENEDEDKDGDENDDDAEDMEKLIGALDAATDFGVTVFSIIDKHIKEAFGHLNKNMVDETVGLDNIRKVSVCSFLEGISCASQILRKPSFLTVVKMLLMKAAAEKKEDGQEDE